MHRWCISNPYQQPQLPAADAQELRQSLPLWLVLSPPGAPDKRRLMTVQDFFKYTEQEGAAVMF